MHSVPVPIGGVEILPLVGRTMRSPSGVLAQWCDCTATESGSSTLALVRSPWKTARVGGRPPPSQGSMLWLIWCPAAVECISIRGSGASKDRMEPRNLGRVAVLWSLTPTPHSGTSDT